MKHFQKIRRLTAAVLVVVMLAASMPAALAASFSAYVASGSAAVYEDAELTNKLGSLPKYTVVTVKSSSGGVAKISYNGSAGYVKASAVESVESVAEEATVNTTTKVYKEADTSSHSARLSKGTKVNVIMVNGSWALIEKDGVGGYAKEKYLTYKSAAATQKPADESEPISAAVVNADTKVYKKASTSSASANVKKGTVVEVLTMDDGWAYIRNADGVKAYIKTKYLSEPGEFEPDPTATPAPTATAAPTEAPTAEPTATVKPTAEPEAAQEATVSADTKVYKKASTSSTSAKVKKGTKVEVLEKGDKWCYIRNSAGVYAYIQTKYLIFASDPTAAPSPTATPAPTATATPAPTATVKPTAEPEAAQEAVVNANTKVYKKATTSSASASVKKGTVVEVLEKGDKWSYIRSSAGVYAYIKTKYLTFAPETTATPAPTATPEPTKEPEKTVEAVVNANTLVYSEPDMDGAYASVKKGTLVEVLSVDGDWAYVRSAGGVCAYIKTKYLSSPEDAEPGPTPEVETIVNAVINADTKVYKKASTSSGSAKVKKGTKVEVLKIDGDWAYIRSEAGVYAYIKTKYLSNSESDNYDVYILDEPIPAVVVASKAGVFSQPAFFGASVGSVAQGTKVSIIAAIEDGSWVKITSGSLTGWVDITTLGSADVDDYDPLEGFVRETFGATVVTHTAKFSETMDGGEGEAIAFGTDVTVTAYSPEWAYVQHGEKYGFIPVSDLSRNEYKTLAKGDSGDEVAKLEKALLIGGYFDLVPDKTFDAQTEQAVKRFQKAMGLSETGEAGQTLQRMIYSGKAPAHEILRGGMSKGDSGENVTRLQTRLRALGYLGKDSSVDGSYGVITAAAVSLFQNCAGMSATSKADANTMQKLYSADAQKLSDDKKPADESSGGSNIVDGGQSNNATFISGTLASTVSEYSSGMSNAKKLEYVIYVAQNQLGKPYVYGAEGPSSYDCTGLTYHAFRQIGITLKRTAYNQGYDETYARIENPADLKRGDLVFFDTVSDKDLSDHAGIYLGGGWFIHASSGQGKVVVSTLASGYYSRVYSWGHRVLS